jgi:hypothetical protein
MLMRFLFTPSCAMAVVQNKLTATIAQRAAKALNTL